MKRSGIWALVLVLPLAVTLSGCSDTKPTVPASSSGGIKPSDKKEGNKRIVSDEIKDPHFKK